MPRLGTRAITYTDDEKEAIADLMQDALDHHGWTQTKAAEMAGIDKAHISVLTRTLPEGISAGYLLAAFMGVDIPPIEVARAMGLTKRVEEHLADPETCSAYPRMKKQLGMTTDQGFDPMTALLQAVPVPKRELARQLIQGIIDTMNQ